MLSSSADIQQALPIKRTSHGVNEVRLFRKICGLNFLPVDAGYDILAGVSNSFPLLAGGG
jgi:hypothetical protein